MGRPTSLDYSRERTYCVCSRCGWGLFGHFSLIYHFTFLSLSQRRPDIGLLLSQRAIKPKTTNQPTKGNNIRDFLFASLADIDLQKIEFTLKGKNLLQEEPTLSFESNPLLRRETNM